MPNISELFADLAKRSGVDPEQHEGLKPLLSMTAQIPDDVYEKISTSFLTVSEAKNNRELKNYYTAQAYDGIDKRLPDWLTEAGLDPKLVEELSKEKSSGKRVEMSIRELHKAHQAVLDAKSANDPDAEKKANQRIKLMEVQLAEAKADWERKLVEKDGEVSKARQEMIEYKKGTELNKILSQHQWSDQYAEKTRPILFNALLQEELNKMGAVLTLENEALTLKQADEPDLYFTVNNKTYGVNELVDKIMSENKFKAVAPKASATSTTSGTPYQTSGNGNGGGSGAQRSSNPAFARALERSKADQEQQYSS